MRREAQKTSNESGTRLYKQVPSAKRTIADRKHGCLLHGDTPMPSFLNGRAPAWTDVERRSCNRRVTANDWSRGEAQVGLFSGGESSPGLIRRTFVFLFSADKVRRMRKLICLLVVALHLSGCGLNYHFCPPGQEHDPSRPFASCRPTTTPGANER
jgi:hypothetical protein